MSVESYRDLNVWRQGLELAKECYVITPAFPREELFGLTSQIRRAAASIPANIAEGYGRENTGEYIQFLRVAQGSLKELETHLILSEAVQIACSDAIGPVLQRADGVGRMLRALIRALQDKRARDKSQAGESNV
jgi:four helix bundle protein